MIRVSKAFKFMWTHRYVSVFSISFLTCWMYSNGLWLQLMQMPHNKSEFYERYSPERILLHDVTSENQKKSGLVYDLINMDVDNGVTGDELAQMARTNVSRYISDVADKCHTDHTDKQNESFVVCAGRLVADHFYYSPGGPVAANYARHNSDCDASTYLMMTAAANAGLRTWIVYAPSHAFFAWKDSFGNYRYWETTSENNRGSWADFSNDFYKKTVSRTYYTPRDSAYAERLYQSIIYSDSDDRKSLDASLSQLADNDFASGNLLYAKSEEGRLTQSDVMSLKSGLQNDFTSSDRKMAIGKYYLDHDDKATAYVYLSQIAPESCRDDCINLLAKTRVYYRVIAPFYMFFSTIFDSTDAFYSLDVFNRIMKTLALALFTIFMGYKSHSSYPRSGPPKGLKMIEHKKFI